MPATAASTELPPAPAYMLRGVSLFASGEYRDRKWTPADVREMCRNGKLLGPGGMKLLVPPSVLGHEEEQEWLDRTDLPAAGWLDPDNLRVEADPRHSGHLILKGDVVNVPREVAQKIKAGEYKFGSVEVYDDFKDDFGKSYGKTVRRFALLGGEVPQVKRLGPLPDPEPMGELRRFAERAGVTIRVRTVRAGGAVHTYAETTVMDRQAMTAAIQAAMPGISQAFLDSLPDDKLAELASNLPGAAQPAAPPAAPVPPAGMMAEGEEETETPAEPAEGGMGREELIAALTDLGEDPAELEGMEDDELQALLEDLQDEAAPAETPPADETMADAATSPVEELIAELAAMGQDAAMLQSMPEEEVRKLYAELTGGAPAPAAPPAPPATPMGERKPMKRAAAVPVAEQVERTARKTLSNFKKLNTFAERNYRQALRVARDAHRRDVESFCEQLVRKGIATPAQVKSVYQPLLLPLDNLNPVHTFSDGRVTRKVTAYELKKAELLRMAPVVKFGERLPGGPTSEQDEESKVREFAQTLPPNALQAGGYDDAEGLVQKFSEYRKKDKTLTAKKFLGI